LQRSMVIFRRWKKYGGAGSQETEAATNQELLPKPQQNQGLLRGEWI
jgi:hypothetical protein